VSCPSDIQQLRVEREERLTENTLWLLQQHWPTFQSPVPALLQNQYSTASLYKHPGSSQLYDSSAACQTSVRLIFMR